MDLNKLKSGYLCLIYTIPEVKAQLHGVWPRLHHLPLSAVSWLHSLWHQSVTKKIYKKTARKYRINLNIFSVLIYDIIKNKITISWPYL